MLAILASVQLVVSAPVPKATELSVIVRPLASTVETDDPIDIYVCYTNKEVAEVRLRVLGDEIDPAVNNVWIEVRSPKDKEYRRVSAARQGLPRAICGRASAEDRPKPAGVRPDEMRCAVMRMSNRTHSENDLFTAPGKWSVRGVVVLEDKELTSKAAEIEVRERSKTSATAMKALGEQSLIPYSVTVGEPLEAEEMKLLEEHYPALKGSYTGKLIERAKVLNALCRADYKDFSITVEASLKPVDEYIAKLTGIEEDYMNYLVAVAFFRKGIGKSNVETARKYYDRVKYMPEWGRSKKSEFDLLAKPVKK